TQCGVSRIRRGIVCGGAHWALVEGGRCFCTCVLTCIRVEFAVALLGFGNLPCSFGPKMETPVAACRPFVHLHFNRRNLYARSFAGTRGPSGLVAFCRNLVDRGPRILV